MSPIPRRAYACRWGCGRSMLASRARMAAHEDRCLRNPARRACVTCRHNGYELHDYDPPGDGSRVYRVWYCDRGLQVPRADCNSWEPKGEA